MNTKITFRFYVAVAAPAGSDCEERTIVRDYETDDYEHACELAARDWSSMQPAGYMPGTVTYV